MQRYYDHGALTWVSPGAIRWDREDIDLLLPWLYVMREGRYPPEPVTSGYVGGNRSGVNSYAPFETVCQVAAELDRRLARTGLDCILVEHSYCDQMSDSELAKRYGMEEWEVRRHLQSAVSYISSGKCGRWLACSSETWYCLLFERCKKHRPAISYTDWKWHRQKRWLTNKSSGLTTKIPSNLTKQE